MQLTMNKIEFVTINTKGRASKTLLAAAFCIKTKRFKLISKKNQQKFGINSHLKRLLL